MRALTLAELLPINLGTVNNIATDLVALTGLRSTNERK
jgi:hypothetical protein